MKTNTYLLTALSALVLSACGGGGGGGTPVAPAPAAAQQVDKYAGSWKTTCFLNVNGVSLASNGQTVYQTRTYTFASTGATTASWVWVDTYFPPTDTTCTQASVGNVTRPSTNSVTLDGTATIGANVVDKTTFTAAAPFPGLGAVGSLTINALSFAGSYNEATTGKAVAVINGTTLTFSGSAPFDAGGYPTTLNATVNTTFTKQ